MEIATYIENNKRTKYGHVKYSQYVNGMQMWGRTDDETTELLKQAFLTRLLNGSELDHREIIHKAKKYGIAFDSKYYFLFEIEQDGHESGSLRHLNDPSYSGFDNITKALERLLSKNRSYLVNASENGITGIIGLGADDFKVKYDIVASMKTMIDTWLDRAVTISVGHTFSNLSQIHAAYLSVKKISELKFFLGSNRILFGNEMIGSENREIDTINMIENQIIYMVQNREEDRLQKYINDLFHSMNSRDVVFTHYFMILATINKILEEYGCKLADIIKHPLSLETIINRTTVDDIIQDLNSKFHAMYEYFAQTNIKHANAMMREIKDFIDKHFTEPISLEIIAEKVQRHPIYISKMFKIETGMNFVDYLTSKRINRSKELLVDPTVKAYEISELVGYYSPRYFSKVFRKIVGVTPSEYRKYVCVKAY